MPLPDETYFTERNHTRQKEFNELVEFVKKIEDLFNEKIKWRNNCSGYLFYSENCERYISISTNVFSTHHSATIYYGKVYGCWHESFTDADELYRYWYSMKKCNDNLIEKEKYEQ